MVLLFIERSFRCTEIIKAPLQKIHTDDVFAYTHFIGCSVPKKFDDEDERCKSP